jgi:hypothetical protein
MAKGTLIAAMKIGRAAEDEFHDWCDTGHLPERQRVPGFLVCQQWIGADDPTVSVAPAAFSRSPAPGLPPSRPVSGGVPRVTGHSSSSPPAPGRR